MKQLINERYPGLKEDVRKRILKKDVQEILDELGLGDSPELLDEDDLVSNSNVLGATQQSIKAYVDGGSLSGESLSNNTQKIQPGKFNYEFTTSAETHTLDFSEFPINELGYLWIYGSGTVEYSAVTDTTSNTVMTFITDSSNNFPGSNSIVLRIGDLYQVWRGANNLIRMNNIGGSSLLRSGVGSPESIVTAPVGTLYTRTDGGVGTTLYVKETGAGNTGWAAK